MGSAESIHNDTNNPVEVWFQVDGGACPTGPGGCMEESLQPGSTTGKKWFQVKASNQVCVKYAELAGFQTKTRTVCKDVNSPTIAGQHDVYDVSDILEKKSSVLPYETSAQGDIDLGHHSSIDSQCFVLACLLGLTIIVFLKKIFKAKKTSTVTFSIPYQAQFGETVKIVGNATALGRWDVNDAAPMECTDRTKNNNVWVLTMQVDFPPSGNAPLEYKYVVISADGKTQKWEPCGNRVLHYRHGYQLICRDGWGKCETTGDFWNGNPNVIGA